MIQTHLELAHRFVGVKERAGDQDHPLIVWWLSLVGLIDAHDEVAWCSGFVAGYAWMLGLLPTGLTAAARSWLGVGRPIPLVEASTAHVDVVILARGLAPQPGPDVRQAPGHVGLFYGLDGDQVRILGGNQSNAVTIASFPVSRVLGVRRLT